MSMVTSIFQLKNENELKKLGLEKHMFYRKTTQFAIFLRFTGKPRSLPENHPVYRKTTLSRHILWLW